MRVKHWAGKPSDDWRTSVADFDPGMEAYFAHKGQAMFDPDSRWARYDLATRLGALEPPAAVIASEHDANCVAMLRIHVQPLRVARPDLQVELVNDGGHFLMTKAPSQMAQQLQRVVLTRRPLTATSR